MGVATEPASPRASSTFWRTTALTLALAAALCAGLLAAVVALTDLGDREHMESLLYLLTFGLVLPVCVVAGFALDRAPRELGPFDFTVAAPAMVVGVLGAGALARIVAWDGLFPTHNNSTVLAGLVLLAVIGAAVLSTLPSWLVMAQVTRRALVVLGALAAIILMLSFSTTGLLTARQLVGAAVVAGAVGLALVASVRVRSAPIAVDLLVGLALLLLASDLSNPPALTGGIHQAFFLGPTQSILVGRPMLTETFSQYGVGLFETLAGIFQLVPLGYGTFSLLTGLATGVELIALYVAVRLAGVPQIAAVLAAGLIIAVNIYTPIFTFVSYPSTGALRFGLGWVMILAGVAACRWPERHSVQATPYVLFGVAALWSFEALVYCGSIIVVLALVLARMQTTDVRAFVRSIVARLAGLLLAFVVSNLLFALLVRLFAGGWPAWGDYLAFIRSYSVNGFGTIIVAPWQAGLAIALLYLGSAIVVARLLIARRSAPPESVPLLGLLAMVTAFGITSYTYYLGRSHPQNQFHIAPIAIVLVTAWWAFAARSSRSSRLPERLLLALAPAVIAGLLVVNSATEVRASVPNTIAGQLAQGGPGRVVDRISELWHLPAQNPEVDPALRLEHTYARDAPTVRLLRPDDEVELAVRSDRLNLMPWADPQQDDLILDQTMKRVDAAIEAFPEQTWLVTDGPNADWVGLQRRALDALERRYEVQFVARDGDVRIAQLTARP